ncbi:L-ascorbate peroxidase [Psidium guajava]|nr:L-ascorbate peroxidase [Psidium guajava]
MSSRCFKLSEFPHPNAREFDNERSIDLPIAPVKNISIAMPPLTGYTMCRVHISPERIDPNDNLDRAIDFRGIHVVTSERWGQIRAEEAGFLPASRRILALTW